MVFTRKLCEWCEKPLWSKRADARFCSTRCRMAMWRKQGREQAARGGKQQ